MSGTPLKDIDLNLLVALEALLRTANVTQAARELGLSQSAVSHSLSRLRRLLGDPILVRSRNEMVRTARGSALLVPTQELLRGVERLVSSNGGFPTGSQRQAFRVLSTDYPLLLTLLPLAKRLATHAPGAYLELNYLTTLLPDRELDLGAVDVCLAHVPFDLPSRLHRRPIFHDRLAVIARRGHPELKRGLTRERYERLGHVAFLSRGTEIFQTMVENPPPVHREKRISVASLGLVPELVACCNYVATISYRSALRFRERYPIEIHECPFAIKVFAVELIWHQRDDDDEAHAWLRQTLTEIGADLEQSVPEATAPPRLTVPAGAPPPGPAARRPARHAGRD